MCTCFCRTSLKSIQPFSARCAEWVWFGLVWLARALFALVRSTILNDLLTNRVDYICMNRRLYMGKFIVVLLQTHARIHQNTDDDDDVVDAHSNESIVYSGFTDSLFLRVAVVLFVVVVVVCSSPLVFQTNRTRYRFDFSPFWLYLALESVNTPSRPCVCVYVCVYAIYNFDEIYFVMTFQWISSLFSMLYFRWNSGC